MLFEHFINGNPTELIKLSEYRKDEDMQEIYISKLDELLNTSFTLKAPILFKWHDRNSTCFKFEQTRANYELAEKYLKKAKIDFDKGEHIETKKYLQKALALQIKALNIVLDWKWKDECVRGMPEINERFLLSKICRTRSFMYHNMFMFKTNEAAIRRAYQLSEISESIWKMGNKDYEQKLLCLWNHTKATEEEDFGNKISYSTKAMEYKTPPAEIIEDHKRWQEQNDKVYFKMVEQPPQPAKITLQEAMGYF